MIKKYSIKDIESEDFIRGFKEGIELAKGVALNNGFELIIPDIEDIEILRK